MSTELSLATLVNEDWLESIADRLPGSILAEKIEWESLTLTVGGKLFAMYGEDNLGRQIITIKGDPAENEALRQEFAGIIPGYYSNKKHWNSILLETATISAEHMVALVEESYRLVFATLTKKLQKELQP